MAVSSVSIANIALTMLSANRITSLTQDDENARRVNAVYEHIRDSLLAEHNWNFARKQATLSLLSSGPTLSNWAYSFQLPSDCLRVIRMDYDYPFSIYGRELYTNSSEALIDYIKKVEDEGLFSSVFVQVFASRIAMEIAYGVTESSTQYELMAKRYAVALQEAKWADSQEGIGTYPKSGSFIDSRS